MPCQMSFTDPQTAALTAGPVMPRPGQGLGGPGCQSTAQSLFDPLLPMLAP